VIWDRWSANGYAQSSQPISTSLCRYVHCSSSAFFLNNQHGLNAHVSSGKPPGLARYLLTRRASEMKVCGLQPQRR